MVAENDGKTGVWRVIYVDGKLVGNISVEKRQDVYHKDGEIGYLLLTDYWSKGIMTQAAKDICRIAFEELDIVRITGVYYAPNAVSCRVFEKVGFMICTRDVAYKSIESCCCLYSNNLLTNIKYTVNVKLGKMIATADNIIC